MKKRGSYNLEFLTDKKTKTERNISSIPNLELLTDKKTKIEKNISSSQRPAGLRY